MGQKRPAFISAVDSEKQDAPSPQLTFLQCAPYPLSPGETFLGTLQLNKADILLPIKAPKSREFYSTVWIQWQPYHGQQEKKH